MARRSWLGTRMLDWGMRQMDDLRPDTVREAEGEVLEVGFGTGLNLRFYSDKVTRVVGLDPHAPRGLAAVEERVGRAPFGVERCELAADGELPFESGRFDCVVTTWTLCSIPDAGRALAEMRRVLRPGGRYAFIEHGRAPGGGTARWQDRLNPLWRRIADGCNMNRRIGDLVADAGFHLDRVDHFVGKGPRVLAHLYRGVAVRRD